MIIYEEHIENILLELKRSSLVSVYLSKGNFEKVQKEMVIWKQDIIEKKLYLLVVEIK